MTGSVWNQIEPLLAGAREPSQYIGEEWNAIRKSHEGKLKVAYCYPGFYSEGMSHPGLLAFYELANALEEIACERAFLPMEDFEQMMNGKIPLFTLESSTPVSEFDVLFIPLIDELLYTRIIKLLRLAGITLLAAERNRPMVIGGGPCSLNPEPLADIFDAFVISPDEEAALPLLLALARGEKGLAEVPGTYLPAKGVSNKISRTLYPDFVSSCYPVSPIVPSAEIFRERLTIEVARGARVRQMDTILRLAESSYISTGYDEISFNSDHPDLREILTRLIARFGNRRILFSLPPLKVNDGLKDVPKILMQAKSGGISILAESGPEQELFAAVESSFRCGYNRLSLVYEIGVPGDGEKRIQQIVETAKKCAEIGKSIHRRWMDINVVLNPFVPRPFTAYERAPMFTFAAMDELLGCARSLVRGKSYLHLKIRNPEMAFVRAAFARGDRSLGKCLLKFTEAAPAGSEFSIDAWMKAFSECGIELESIASRERPADENLPWSFIE